MSHDDSYEAFALARREELEFGRRSIEARLRKIASALRTFGMQGASDIEEAILHIKGV